jgi:hypothetical protein
MAAIKNLILLYFAFMSTVDIPLADPLLSRKTGSPAEHGLRKEQGRAS